MEICGHVCWRCIACFEDLDHDNVVAEFKKLQQKDNVSEYRDKVEELKALILGKNQH